MKGRVVNITDYGVFVELEEGIEGLVHISELTGRVMVKNIVALGALHAATRLFPDETYLTAIRPALADKPALVPLNEQAFARGMELARRSEEVGCGS